MKNTDLIIRSGLCSEAGIKPANEDSVGINVPESNLLNAKGIAAVIADGVSGSEAGKDASNACVQGFLSDYLSTPDSWTVKTSGHKVLTALNRWLYGQGHQLYGTSRGLVTTLSILVLKSTTAHLFHIGDTRIYRIRNNDIECLTRDHRVQVSGDKSYLSRAMGIELMVDIDYRALPIEEGDAFLMTTDGIHDFLSDEKLLGLSKESSDLKNNCKAIVDAALASKSNDNISCQLVIVDQLPTQDKNKVYEQLTELPFPPPLEPGMRLDGYKILRELHASKRSELFLAVDEESDEQVVIKAPSINYEDDPTYIDMFLHEEWIGKRIDSGHVLKIMPGKRKRKFLYCLTEYIEGQTLRQWMRDHPLPSVSDVRGIVEQIAKGLRAFHRLEMIHQDLKPENIMIDNNGTAKIIDFGSTKIAGIEEIASPISHSHLLGTENYSAPEYLQGQRGSNRSDIYSLGVITYEMLAGRLPYGESPSRRSLNHLDYRTIKEKNPEVAAWIDGALKKAVDPDPTRRYETLSEFLHDLSNPNPEFLKSDFVPLIKSNPVGFWRTIGIVMTLLNLFLIYLLTN